MSKQKRQWGRNTRLYLASVGSSFEPIRPKVRDVICLDEESESYKDLAIEGLTEGLYQDRFGYPPDICVATILTSFKLLPDGTCEQTPVYTTVIFCNRIIIAPPAIARKQATIATYARSQVLKNATNDHDSDVWASLANFGKILKREFP